MRGTNECGATMFRCAERCRTSRWTFCIFGASASVFAACLGIDAGELELGRAPRIIGLDPSEEVAMRAVVHLAFSTSVEREGDEWPVTVTRRDGRRVAVSLDPSEDGSSLGMIPVDGWPVGERLAVAVEKGFIDREGRALAVPDTPLSFSTASGAAPRPRAIVRMPTPAQLAPTNLRYIAIAIVPDSAPPPWLELASATGTARATFEASSAAGVHRYVLVDEDGACLPLCTSTEYRVVSADPSIDVADGARGAVRTSSSADHIAPTVTATSVVPRGEDLSLRVDASEPVILEGYVELSYARRIPVDAPVTATRPVVVEAREALPTDEAVVFSIRGRDVAGNELARFTVYARTPPHLRLRINEIVTTPLRDWGDSVRNGAPFDGHPGTGSVTDADEWVELVNESDHAIDLATADARLDIDDGSPSTTRLDGAPAVHFGDGGSLRTWWPGEALVVRTNGTMQQRDVAIEVWSGDRRADRVTLGREANADHVGGAPPDATHEALARDAFGRWRWCVPSPGDSLPPTDCVE